MLWLSAAFSAGATREAGPVPDLAQPVTVYLASGRKLSARVDPRSDTAQLILRSGNDSVSITRPVDWDRVIRVETAVRTLSGEELRQLIAWGPRLEEVPAPAAMRYPTPFSRQRAFTEKIPAPPGPALVDGPPQLPAPTSRVVSLEINTMLDRWGTRAEPDGLALQLRTMDRDGHVVPVNALVEVELHGEEVHRIYSLPPTRVEIASADSRTIATSTERILQPAIRLERWQQPVRQADFGPDGAVVRLPFQSFNPQQNQSIDSYGVVSVRLSVPGHGVYEAAQRTVRIRPYSASGEGR
jgi:hypothetical protein